MSSFFITATDTDAGKTYVASKILEEFKKRGKRSVGYKPIESGVLDIPQDTKKLHMSSDVSFKFKEINSFMLPLASSPYVANSGKKFDLEIIKKDFLALKNRSEAIFVEGAGGLCVPINIDFFMYDLIDFLDLTPILVVPSKLGSINHTLLSIELLKRLEREFFVVFNVFDKEDFYKITYPFYKDFFKSGNLFIFDEQFDEFVDKLINFNNR